MWESKRSKSAQGRFQRIKHNRKYRCAVHRAEEIDFRSQNQVLSVVELILAKREGGSVATVRSVGRIVAGAETEKVGWSH